MLAQISPPEQAYAYWQPFAEDAKKKPVQLVWRVHRAMGFGQGKEPSQLQPANVFQGAPNIVVVSEGGMGFGVAWKTGLRRQWNRHDGSC